MNQDRNNLLIEELSKFAKAKNPIDYNLLKELPYFTSIFPEDEILSVIVSLSGDDGIAFIEKKKFKEGEKIISKDQFDQMIYWVLEGHAHVLADIKKKKKIIHEASTGECVGALGVLRGTMRIADVVAGEDGVTVIEIDWAITEKNSELATKFYHLIALSLADKLDKSYYRQIRIISNSINVLHEKTTHLIEENKRLEKALKDNKIKLNKDEFPDSEFVLSHAIANIRESLSLLQYQEVQSSLDKFAI